MAIMGNFDYFVLCTLFVFADCHSTRRFVPWRHSYGRGMPERDNIEHRILSENYPSSFNDGGYHIPYALKDTRGYSMDIFNDKGSLYDHYRRLLNSQYMSQLREQRMPYHDGPLENAGPKYRPPPIYDDFSSWGDVLGPYQF